MSSDHEVDARPGGQKAPSHGAHDSHATHTNQAGTRSGERHQSAQMAHAGGAHEGHEGHGVEHTGHEALFRRRFWISSALTIPVLLFSPLLQQLIGFSMPEFPFSSWVGPVFGVIIFAVGGVPFLQMAVPELKGRRPGMMTLISLAIVVAFMYSLAASIFNLGSVFFWEMATLIDIMLLGHWFEMRSVRQASGALDELAKLMPDTAERVQESGAVEKVPLEELRAGDLVLVRPGASVPADGDVVDGESNVDESMITGESRPVEKGPDDEVIGGTVNAGGGGLRVRVKATGEDTALAGIMRLVKEAQGSKSNTQLLADRAAGWLFYIALGVAGVTAVAWLLAVGFEIQVLSRVVTVLVIACPHALGLAIPLVVAISTTLGARNGILVRDRLALEESRKVDTVLFDKTGTLTKGEFGVVAVETTDEWEEENALGLAAAIERDSEHTIAQGIRQSAQQRSLTLPHVEEFHAIAGQGVRASWEGATVYLGGPRLLQELEVELPAKLADFAAAASAKGQSVVHLIHGHEPVASFALADAIREESYEAVRKLKELGVDVAMITGDSEQVARAVAQELGIETYFAEVLPENKDQKVRELQGEGKRVAMVGDGVNDAPALTRADVGIAIGSGTDVAVESAGIILVKSNPLDIVRIVRLSQETYRKMIQNLIWATGYNVIALPLAAGVLAPIGVVLSPAVGALLMSLSTVIVAINAQLLRRADLSA
jgi:Cu2+-exporting ATPase